MKCIGSPIVKKMGIFSPKMNNNFDQSSSNELKVGSNLEEHEWKKMLGTEFWFFEFF